MMMKYLFDNKARHGSDSRSVVKATGTPEMEDFFLSKLRAQMKKCQWSHPKAGHSGGKCIKGIPNIRQFKIEVGVIDKLYQEFGVNKKTEPVFTAKPHVNGSVNRYVAHQLKRCDKALLNKNYTLYGRIALRLIQKSNSYLLMGINGIFPRGYKDQSLDVIFRIALKVRSLSNNPEAALKFHRTYIPKGNQPMEYGKVRPLGVPKPEGRVLLHMGNNLLVFYFEGRKLMPNEQHGFRPGRGTTTAWKEILKKVIQSNNIYEVDFTNYFNTIRLNAIKSALEGAEIPENIVKKLIGIHSVSPTLPKELLMDESSEIKKAQFIANRQSIEDNLSGATMPIDVTPNHLGLKESYEKGKYSYSEEIGTFKTTDMPPVINIEGDFYGVPQGAPTSPFLSTLVLNSNTIGLIGKGIGYADDVVFYDTTDEPTENEIMKKIGIKIKKEKSGGIRKDGKGLKELKFLGLIYNGERDTLRADTRKGSTLEYDKEDLAKALSDRKKRKLNNELIEIYEDSKGGNLIASNIMGFIMSRLYTNKGNPEIKEEEMGITGKKHSGLEKRNRVKLLSKRYNTKIDLYNCSSFALDWLGGQLKKRLESVKTDSTLEQPADDGKVLVYTGKDGKAGDFPEEKKKFYDWDEVRKSSERVNEWKRKERKFADLVYREQEFVKNNFFDLYCELENIPNPKIDAIYKPSGIKPEGVKEYPYFRGKEYIQIVKETESDIKGTQEQENNYVKGKFTEDQKRREDKTFGMNAPNTDLKIQEENKMIQTRYWAKVILKIDENHIMNLKGQIIPKGKLTKFKLKSIYGLSSQFFKGGKNPNTKKKIYGSFHRLNNVRKNILPLIDITILLSAMQIVNELGMSCQREVPAMVLEMEYGNNLINYDPKSYLFGGILMLTTVIIGCSFYDHILYHFQLQEWRLAQEAAMITDPILRYQMGILGPLSERDLEQLQLFLANQAVIDNLATSPISYRGMEMWLF